MPMVVTGLGALASIGGDAESFWSALCRGECGIRPLARIDAAGCGGPGRLGAEIPAGVLERVPHGKAFNRLDRVQMATLAAARMAWESAALGAGRHPAEELGIVLGSTLGYIESVTSFYTEALVEGPSYVSPVAFANTVMNAPAGKVAIEYGIKGLCSTIANGETSGLDAVGYASDFLDGGQCGAVLVGAAAVLCEATYAGFHRAEKLSGSRPGEAGAEACRPFDRRANGLVLGEGAAMLVLEEAERARRAGAPALAEIRGYRGGFVLDVRDRAGFVAAVAENVEGTLAAAGLRAADVSAVSASAGSDPYLDGVEAAALAQVFGAGGTPAVTAVKAAVGECLDASSLLQAVAAVLAIRDQCIPPIAGFEPAAAALAGLDYAAALQRRPVDWVLVNAISCGGRIASMLVGRAGAEGR